MNELVNQNVTDLSDAPEEIKEQIVHNAELLDNIANEIKEGMKS